MINIYKILCEPYSYGLSYALPKEYSSVVDAEKILHELIMEPLTCAIDCRYSIFEITKYIEKTSIVITGGEGTISQCTKQYMSNFNNFIVNTPHSNSLDVIKRGCC